MSSRRYDALATARDLESTGLERPQAEAIAQAIGSHGERLATSDDIERLEARTASKEDIARLEAQSDCASVLLPVWRAPISTTTGEAARARSSRPEATLGRCG